jgi:hypothetical protein
MFRKIYRLCAGATFHSEQDFAGLGVGVAQMRPLFFAPRVIEPTKKALLSRRAKMKGGRPSKSA